MYDFTEGRIKQRRERIITVIIVLLFLFIIISLITGCTTLKTAFSTPVIELKVINEADILHNKQQSLYLFCPIQPPANHVGGIFCVIQSCLKKIKNRAAVSIDIQGGQWPYRPPEQLFSPIRSDRPPMQYRVLLHLTAFSLRVATIIAMHVRVFLLN